MIPSNDGSTYFVCSSAAAFKWNPYLEKTGIVDATRQFCGRGSLGDRRQLPIQAKIRLTLRNVASA
eukprot:m.247590 g.247590  ORF g.247590 m.247590 type:complete len:66 (+) comp40274_c0_seq2:115-312(+)